jgi:peptide chain release factor 3
VSQPAPALVTEAAKKRRTFAIISHPDAGKTTLTEKLLLYGGAIQQAGSVKAKASHRKATSDWMELEKQRGISVTSTVLQFPYQGHIINLLDTPGHNDFSADTYRTLTAADSAVMLVDNAKGVETQTRKLFAVCRRRGIPIFTFVNKMDHDGMGPLAIMEDIEEALGIRSVPMNWPIGQGVDFTGVYDRSTKLIHLYERTARGATKAGLSTISIDDPEAKDIVGEKLFNTLIEDIELLDVAADPFDADRVQSGELTPIFFGSALTNFGVEPFLQTFIQMAPKPAARKTETKEVIPEDKFSAFVFKIQANMNPEHRDRIAFLRIVSGEFEKDMDVIHVQSGKTLKVSRPQRVFAQEREIIEEAFAGDIIGIPNPGFLRLGDTLALDSSFKFDEVPGFTPEIFASITSMDASRFKHFDKGVHQLSEEGLIDLFEDPDGYQKQYIFGAVGVLQFDVVKFRLATEYGVKTQMMPLSQSLIAWVEGDVKELDSFYLGSDIRKLLDAQGRTVLLFNSQFQMNHMAGRAKNFKLLNEPGGAPIGQ